MSACVCECVWVCVRVCGSVRVCVGLCVCGEGRARVVLMCVIPLHIERLKCISVYVTLPHILIRR